MHNLETLHHELARLVDQNRARWQAEDLTRDWRHMRGSRLDRGRQCIEDSPIFGGQRQGDLFTGEDPQWLEP